MVRPNRYGLPRSAVVALAGAALLLVAAFLPWSVESGGAVHTGLDHDDGYLTFGVVVVVLAVVLGRQWSPGARVATALASLLPIWYFVKWFRAIRAESVSEPAVGLYLTLLAGLLLLGGAAYSVVDRTVPGERRAAVVLAGSSLLSTDGAESDDEEPG